MPFRKPSAQNLA